MPDKAPPHPEATLLVDDAAEIENTKKSLTDPMCAPKGPGVYFILNPFRVVRYIGEALNLRERIFLHWRGRSAQSREGLWNEMGVPFTNSDDLVAWVAKTFADGWSVHYIETETKEEAYALEQHYIIEVFGYDALWNREKVGIKKGMYNYKDEMGNVYGAIRVVAKAPSKPQGNALIAMWLCRCDCGEEVLISGTNLRNGGDERPCRHRCRAEGCYEPVHNTKKGKVKYCPACKVEGIRRSERKINAKLKEERGFVLSMNPRNVRRRQQRKEAKLTT